jgi:hypothetical protein
MGLKGALAFQLGHNSLGVPLQFMTKGGLRCGHYIQITTTSGRAGFRFVRDPNTVCGLPSQNPDVSVCASNPGPGGPCGNTALPPGVTQIGTTGVTGRSPNELLGNVRIR